MNVKKCMVDSSSAILLFKCGMISRVSSHYDVIITESIYSELTSKDRPGRDEFIKLREKGIIRAVTESEYNTPSSFTSLKGLGKGEFSAINSLLHGCADFIIIDDRRGANYCRKQGLPYVNAILMVKIMFLSGKITLPEYTLSFEYLVSHGRYSQAIIDFVHKCNETDIRRFFPDGLNNSSDD